MDLSTLTHWMVAIGPHLRRRPPGSRPAERTSTMRVVMSARSRCRPRRMKSYPWSWSMVPESSPLTVWQPRMTRLR